MSRGSNAHEQCITRCPVSRLVHSPGRPAKSDYLESFHPGSQHHNTGIPANRAGSVIIAKLIFFLRLTKVSGSLQSEPAGLM